ncbi:hypothetical protein [Flavobacterium reichenbachii]|uniref:Tetratricopeptide repeat protein n=1 Tax=Flavobacterium reichenbachii TaxID=362418 RepID=A0A085ZIF7_9FLAO|nr:hypothetical protein [Flavobacterium reichenbachii]KFF04221.1 hypothetical protein IW19_01190 [Flavobacterium reichenbachii]OXB13879.1 hypothetical protein B0A68_14115 [Flavobacterium reichenbachii]
MRVLFITLLITFQTFAQNDSKTSFQKGRYELAVSYYKKADFVKAIDLFSIASKIKPETEIGQEAAKKVDTLKEILRKDILEKAVGTWKDAGDKPVWSSDAVNTADEKTFDETIEITQTQILFSQIDKKSHAKKLIKTENIVYNDTNNSGSLYSEIVLSDGSIWNCMINEKGDILRVINVAKKTENGIEKIQTNNLEHYFMKI